MVSWFLATQAAGNKRNSFIQMIKIVGNCDKYTADRVYNKYANSSYIQRLALGRDLRKRHQEIVYGDKKGEFYTGISKAAPYPFFPVTQFISGKLNFIPQAKLYDRALDTESEEMDFYQEDIEFFDVEDTLPDEFWNEFYDNIDY